MDYRAFTNAALLARLRELAVRDRGTVCDFVACLAEADRRAEAILEEGYPRLFEFCVRDLKLAESTAYQRVSAAKLTRTHPEILSLLADGSINLSNLCRIADRLEEHPSLLALIVGKTKREVDALVASFGAPREIPDRVRPLAPAAAPQAVAGLFDLPPTSEPSFVELSPSVPISPPAAPETRTEFRFAAGPRFVDAVERLRALLWHKHPAGRLEDLLFEAASDFLARRDPAREPKRARDRIASARPRSRRIPAALRSITSRRGRWAAAPTRPRT